MKEYNKEDFTYGYEIEFGDIDRGVEIPKELGSWEYCECDIVNLNPPYRGIAVDPAGLNPPVGGEINTKPTNTWEEQFKRVVQIRDLFQNPTASHINHGHVHVRIPGLTGDIHALRQLTEYIAINQDVTINNCYYTGDYNEDVLTGDPNKTYLKWDGGRKMPEWMTKNIIDKSKDFDDFIRIQCCGKDGVSRGRPFRYGINTYCLKHTDTIEFRCFRGSTEPREIHDSLRFAEEFIYAALNTGERVESILGKYDYQFPSFNYDREMSLSWKKTKHAGDSSLKRRKLYEVG